MTNADRMHCFRANTWYRSENTRTVCVFVSPVLIPSSTDRRVDRFHPTRYLSHLPARIFHCMRLRKITTQRNFLCLWSKIIRKASLAHHKLKQGPHIHQTYDPPSPPTSWENCRAVPSQQLSHVLCGVCRGTKGRLIHTYIHTYFIGSSPRGFSESTHA